MLPGEPEPPAAPHAHGRELRLAALRAGEGWWDAAVRAGDEVVAEGGLLGRVRNLWGDVLEEIRAPRDGVVLFSTTSPAVDADGILLGLGADLEPVTR